MPRIYKRICNNCRKYYKGLGKYYCGIGCRIVTESHRNNISKALKGRIPKNIEKLKRINIGRKLTEKHKQNISKAKKGVPLKLTDKQRKMRGKKGAECNLWKGGKTDFTKRFRENYKWRLWREKVFKRDDYTCKKCGAKSGSKYDGTVYLEPHHCILGVTRLVKDKMEKYIYNINNGITLCKDCHNLTKGFNNAK